jgi:threonine dehydrogenase-like Zn-dependent dehydrogenase
MLKPAYPLIFGGYGIGRIASVGPDTTAFTPGQLVMMEPFIRARDDPDIALLWSAFPGMDDKTRKFNENYRDGCWAEYCLAPLENVWAINEAKILNHGTQLTDLAHLAPLAVAYGGLRKIDLKVGETVLIAPATGVFSGGAVALARSMGAKVIAAGRSAQKLQDLAAQFPGITTVQLKGGPEDLETLKSHGPIDVVVDVSPPEATENASLAVCMQSVRRGGRICLLGGRLDQNLPIPYVKMIFDDVTIRGSWMYEPEHVKGLIKMVESGVLRLNREHGFEILGSYKLEDFEEALDAAQGCAAGKVYVLSSEE